jgi:hypothetical protein
MIIIIIIIIITIIIITPRLKPMKKIPMHVKHFLANLRKHAFPELKGESKLQRYGIMYIYTKLEVVKCI